MQKILNYIHKYFPYTMVLVLVVFICIISLPLKLSAKKIKPYINDDDQSDIPQILLQSKTDQPISSLQLNKLPMNRLLNALNQSNIKNNEEIPVAESKFTQLPVDAKVEKVEYDFSKPVPESTTVDSTYFKDAVFVGDSRTQGLMTYTGLESTFYAARGMNIQGVYNNAFIEDTSTGEKITRTILDTFKAYPNFKKVYISFGLNELGWEYSSIFIEKYEYVIDEIEKILPDAIIYVQSIFPVSDKSNFKDAKYCNNERINEYNGLLKSMAERKKVYYITLEEALADSSGVLSLDASSDGIHLNKKYTNIWLDYLKVHTVDLNAQKRES